MGGREDKYRLFKILFNIVYKDTFISIIRYLRKDNITSIKEDEIDIVLNEQESNIETISNILIIYILNEKIFNDKSYNLQYRLIESLLNGFNLRISLYNKHPYNSLFRYNVKWIDKLRDKIRTKLQSSYIISDKIKESIPYF